MISFEGNRKCLGDWPVGWGNRLAAPVSRPTAKAKLNEWSAAIRAKWLPSPSSYSLPPPPTWIQVFFCLSNAFTLCKLMKVNRCYFVDYWIWRTCLLSSCLGLHLSKFRFLIIGFNCCWVWRTLSVDLRLERAAMTFIRWCNQLKLTDSADYHRPTKLNFFFRYFFFKFLPLFF